MSASSDASSAASSFGLHSTESANSDVSPLTVSAQTSSSDNNNFPNELIPFTTKDDIRIAKLIVDTDDANLLLVAAKTKHPNEEVRIQLLRDALKNMRNFMKKVAYHAYQEEVVIRAVTFGAKKHQGSVVGAQTVKEVFKFLLDTCKDFDSFLTQTAQVFLIPINYSHTWLWEARKLFEKEYVLTLMKPKGSTVKSSFDKIARKYVKDRIDKMIGKDLLQSFGARCYTKNPVKIPRKGKKDKGDKLPGTAVVGLESPSATKYIIPTLETDGGKKSLSIWVTWETENEVNTNTTDKNISYLTSVEQAKQSGMKLSQLQDMIKQLWEDNGTATHVCYPW